MSMYHFIRFVLLSCLNYSNKLIVMNLIFKLGVLPVEKMIMFQKKVNDFVYTLVNINSVRYNK